MILTNMNEKFIAASQTLPNILISPSELCLQAAKADEIHLRKNAVSVSIQDLVHIA